MRTLIIALLIFLPVLSHAATKLSKRQLSHNQTEATEIRFSHPGYYGAFDPSVEGDPRNPNWVWMAYSSGEENLPPHDDADSSTIVLRLAKSEDGGRSFVDQMELSPRMQQRIMIPGGIPAIWHYEVPSLVRDDQAPADERWKVFAMRYLKINRRHCNPATQPCDNGRFYSHSWIAYRSAPEPEGPWSPEKKFLSGSVYNESNTLVDTLSPLMSAPLLRHTMSTALQNCAAFTEPAAVSTTHGLYIAFTCATGNADTDRIITLKRDQNGQWYYRGVLFDAEKARSIGLPSMDAADLFAFSGKIYLSLSAHLPGHLYQGCHVFEVTNLSTSQLRMVGETQPAVVSRIPSLGAHLNGGCTYDRQSGAMGMYIFERLPTLQTQPFLKIWATEQSPWGHHLVFPASAQ